MKKRTIIVVFLIIVAFLFTLWTPTTGASNVNQRLDPDPQASKAAKFKAYTRSNNVISRIIKKVPGFYKITPRFGVGLINNRGLNHSKANASQIGQEANDHPMRHITIGVRYDFN